MSRFALLFALVLVALCACATAALGANCDQTGGSTDLQNAAANLGVGEWCELVVSGDDINTVFYCTSGSATLCTGYADSMGWDPINNLVRFVGHAHLGESGFFTYTESTNAWTKGSPPVSDTGHGYDHNTTDPATGDHYFRQGNSGIIRKFDGSSWSVATTYGGSVQVAGAIKWFPSRSELLFVDNYAGIRKWTVAGGWAAIDATSEPFDSMYHQEIEYSPALDLMWIMDGNGGTVQFKYDSTGTLTALSAAPSGRLGVTSSLTTVDPIGGLFIQFDYSEEAWYTYDISTNTWAAIAHSMPPLCGTGNCNEIDNIEVSILEYGVIMFVSWTENATFLYKHSVGTAACADGLDNDGDGMIDLLDPSCADAADTDEDAPGSTFETRCKGGDVVRCYGFEDETDLFTGNTQDYCSPRRAFPVGDCSSGVAGNPAGVALCAGLDTDSPGSCVGGVDAGDFCDVDSDCADSDCSQCNGLVTDVKSTGKSSLRFETPDGSDDNNSGSVVIPFTDDWSFFVVPSGETPAGGGVTYVQELWIQVRERMNSVMTDTDGFGTDTGWKSFIVGLGDEDNTQNASSCTDQEIVLRNTDDYGLGMYHSCPPGQQVFQLQVVQSAEPWQCAGSTPYIYQQIPRCCYPVGSGPVDGCFFSTADTWTTYTLHLVVGDWGVDAGNLIEMWAQADGGTEYKVFDSDVVWPSGIELDGEDGAQWGKVWLLKYITSKNPATSHAVGYSWFDDLIISESDPRVAVGSSVTGGTISGGSLQ